MHARTHACTHARTHVFVLCANNSPGVAARRAPAHSQSGAAGKRARRRRRHSSNAARGPPALSTSAPQASQAVARGG
eukprot:5117046-Lingulodinium_polyedra.AAC.1